ncbi:hypothetical protein [Arthrobacter antioxidans]|uniref:hypothetical protein n=1 Tax=Arthrobacter antioxidans TaxID=2895818 RepID=UPI001FFEE0A2|nr:hypothetical protein [Arthrobacter antioxidans]
MVPQLFHLEGPSLEELKAKAAALYGPRALIVSAELVTVGGIRGVLARKHYEIVVEVPEPDGEGGLRAGTAGSARSRGGSPDGPRGGPVGGPRAGSRGGSPDGALGGAPGGAFGAPGGGRPRGRRSAAAGPSGLDALLQQAELDEVRIASGPDADRAGAPEPRSAPPAAVSTDSGLFAALMDELTFATDPAAAPVPSSMPGASGDAGAGAARTRRSIAVDRDAVASSASGLPDVPGAGTAGTRRSIAVDRDAWAEDPDRGSSDSTRAGAGFGRESGAASDAEFLRERAGDPTDLPEVRGQVLRVPVAAPAAPSVLRAPGDLVIVVGAPAAGWAVASSMATVLGRGAPAAVAVSGPPDRVHPEGRSVDDRLEANAARAAGVDGGHAVFVALSSEDPLVDARALLALRPDQVWLAVDAGRKEADTAAWVGALRRSMERAGLAPAGLAVVGSATTATPESVQALGLPIGWLEGRPAGEVETSPAAASADDRLSAPAGPRRPGSGRRRAEPAGIE